MNQNKPAVCLDDDPMAVSFIINSFRVLGGVPVKYFPSIEAFLRYHDVHPDDTDGLKKALESYSVLDSDNNFEAAQINRSYPGDGKMGGINFLNQFVGPAIKEMDEATRPMVVCFAPSNGQLVKNTQDYFWETFGILSIDKMSEFSLAGLAVRIRRETGVLLSRKQLITDILNLPDGEIKIGSPVWALSIDMHVRHLIFPDEVDNGAIPRSFEAKSLEWNELITSFASKLNIGPQEFVARIDRETQINRRGKENASNRTSNKEIES